MDWNNWNFSSTDTTLPAVNIRENNDAFMIEMAAPGMTRDDFKVHYDNRRLNITLPKREEVKPKPAREIKVS